MVLIPSVRAAPFLSRASVASSGRLFGKPFVTGALWMVVVTADGNVSMVKVKIHGFRWSSEKRSDAEGWSPVTQRWI